MRLLLLFYLLATITVYAMEEGPPPRPAYCEKSDIMESWCKIECAKEPIEMPVWALYKDGKQRTKAEVCD